MNPGVALHNREGKTIGNLDFPIQREGPVDTAILWQATRMTLANKRQGTADTKTRSEVRGGGRKPWRQKHTGRARHGSIRSPIWRKGGVVFGPHPRDYRYALPQKLRRKALLESLKVRLGEEAIFAVENLDGLPPKTKELENLLRRMKVEDRVLVVVERPDSTLVRMARNLPKVQVKTAKDLNCYDVLRHPKILVTKGALEQLKELVAS